jgi:hypothetical protein
MVNSPRCKELGGLGDAKVRRASRSSLHLSGYDAVGRGA